MKSMKETNRIHIAGSRKELLQGPGEEQEGTEERNKGRGSTQIHMRCRHETYYFICWFEELLIMFCLSVLAFQCCNRSLRAINLETAKISWLTVLAVQPVLRRTYSFGYAALCSRASCLSLGDTDVKERKLMSHNLLRDTPP